MSSTTVESPFQKHLPEELYALLDQRKLLDGKTHELLAHYPNHGLIGVEAWARVEKEAVKLQVNGNHGSWCVFKDKKITRSSADVGSCADICDVVKDLLTEQQVETMSPEQIAKHFGVPVSRL